MLTLEVGLALVLTGVLLVSLTAAVGAHRRGVRSLSEHRAAVNAAERALADLRSGQPLRERPGVVVDVVPLPDASGVEGFRWVEARTVLGAGRATLVGLVPVEEVRR